MSILIVNKDEKVLEKTIEAAAVRFAKKHNIFNLKMNTRFRAHWPDRQFFFPNQPLFVEYKAPGKRATPAQHKIHEQLRALGYIVYVIDNVAEAIQVLRVWMQARTLGAAFISEVRYEIYPTVRERGVVHGPRTRKNKRVSRRIKDTTEAKAS